jgi:hypothetical protein
MGLILNLSGPHMLLIDALDIVKFIQINSSLYCLDVPVGLTYIRLLEIRQGFIASFGVSASQHLKRVDLHLTTYGKKNFKEKESPGVDL